MKQLMVILSLLITTAAAHAQPNLPPPPEAPKRITIDSKVLGEQRSVLVRVPLGYDRTTTRYPLLLITDGDANFSHTVSTVEFLSRTERMPEMIIVGISNTDRTRDLTPTHKPYVIAGQRQFATSGGSQNFIRFIETELIPHIDRTYRTLSWRMYAGHSFGGLLALDLMVSRPKLFNAWVAASPSFDWDDRWIEKKTATHFKRNPNATGSLFISFANEGDVAIAGFERYKALLEGDAPKSLTWSTRFYPDEDHGSVVLPTYYEGLRKVFDGWRAPRDADGAIVTDLVAMEAHYAQLSQRLGIRIPVSEQTYNIMGYQLLQRGDTAAAIATLQKAALLYPLSANAHDSLGEAYERSGDLKKAADSYGQATELGRKNNHPNLDIFETNYARAAKAAGKR